MAAVTGKVSSSSSPPSSPPAHKSTPPSPVLKSTMRQIPSTSSQSSPIPAVTLPQSQTPTSLWKHLFSNSSSQKPFPSPTFSEDGIPIVQAPAEIILKASEAWKGYILCTFFGTPPPPKKIYTDLNPIWGKNGDITVRRFSEGSCLIYIPSARTRNWVLDVGFWSAGTVAFSTSEWTSSSKLHNSHLSSAPLWLTFSDIPPQLWSLDGLRLIASGVGSPVPSNRPSLSSAALGKGRIRVIINLERPLPPAVLVRDSDGNSVRIVVDYGRLPPLCSLCSRFDHSDHRCPNPRRSVPATVNIASVNPVACPPSSVSVPSPDSPPIDSTSLVPLLPPPQICRRSKSLTFLRCRPYDHAAHHRPYNFHPLLYILCSKP